MKIRIAVLALAALAVLGACGQVADRKAGGFVEPAPSESTATTSPAPEPLFSPDLLGRGT